MKDAKGIILNTNLLDGTSPEYFDVNPIEVLALILELVEDVGDIELVDDIEVARRFITGKWMSEQGDALVDIERAADVVTQLSQEIRTRFKKHLSVKPKDKKWFVLKTSKFVVVIGELK
ncbi:MAG: hypothetical protein IBX57_00105 [Gammaproteobacteria bacterium]|nr:hypothetical protein [Gammaproteobacteria bacterium]